MIIILGKMWSQHTINALKGWFRLHQRKLPWRIDKTPYKVWISEVMLQQTQVSVVIPYFHRWLEVFPTVVHLAQATVSDVIKTWEGLGYYSRGRNLHRSAEIIVKEYEGKIPETSEELQKLPGLGLYTVGAILSFAFQKKAAAVDGNVIRVLSRLFALSQDVSKKTYFHGLMLSLLPETEPWIVMEALIELGATICKKQPLCLICPIASECQAYQERKTDHYPLVSKKILPVYLQRTVGIFKFQDKVLVRLESNKVVMSGLYEFPYEAFMDQAFNILNPHKIFDFPLIKHGFTKYKVTLRPSLYEVKEEKEVPGLEWKTIKDLSFLPFSSGHRKLLKKFLNSI